MKAYLNIIRLFIVTVIGLHVYITNDHEPELIRQILTLFTVVLIGLYGELHRLFPDAKN